MRIYSLCSFLHNIGFTRNFIYFRQYTNDYKLETYLKIARLFLEDEDPIQAEAYINRASLLQADSQNEQLQIHYKVQNLSGNVTFDFPKCSHLIKTL